MQGEVLQVLGEQCRNHSAHGKVLNLPPEKGANHQRPNEDHDRKIEGTQQTLKQRDVDLYLCGEVHAITCTQADGVLQIAHGGLFGYNPKVNYLVATVWPDEIELELKEIAISNEGERLWQVGNNRPHERVTISDTAKTRGYDTVGRAVLGTDDARDRLVSRTGCFQLPTSQASVTP